jgi:hypothetical protein
VTSGGPWSVVRDLATRDEVGLFACMDLQTDHYFVIHLTALTKGHIARLIANMSLCHLRLQVILCATPNCDPFINAQQITPRL